MCKTGCVLIRKPGIVIYPLPRKETSIGLAFVNVNEKPFREMSDVVVERPGGKIAQRELHFIWIADCSSSMSGEKINALNQAISESIPHMRDVASTNAHAQVLVRAVSFADGAQWHISQPTPVEDFTWPRLSPSGLTDMGRALSLVAEELRVDRLGERGFPPVLALITDGHPTDDFDRGLAELMANPWGKRAVRVAIAIGHDADHDVLQRFIGHPEIKPLQANNPERLKDYIRFVSTTVLKAASAPSSQAADGSAQKVNIPVLIPPAGDDDDVF